MRKIILGLAALLCVVTAIVACVLWARRAPFGATRGWTVRENDHFVAHGESAEALDEVVAKAEFALEKAGRMLDLAPLPRKPHLYVVRNPETWKAIREKSGWREEGRALLYQGCVFVLEQPDAPAIREDVFHEIVHLRLRAACRQGLPLWLEEGLALDLGWRIMAAYHLPEATLLRRHRPPADPSRLLSMPDLEALREYPEDPAALRAFYCQAEALVRGIIELVGEERLPEFVRSACGATASWREILRDQFGCEKEYLDRLEARVTSETAIRGAEG